VANSRAAHRGIRLHCAAQAAAQGCCRCALHRFARNLAAAFDRGLRARKLLPDVFERRVPIRYMIGVDDVDIHRQPGQVLQEQVDRGTALHRKVWCVEDVGRDRQEQADRVEIDVFILDSG